jgi:integrase/recombinase XerD
MQLSELQTSSLSILSAKDDFFIKDKWHFTELGYKEEELPGGHNAVSFDAIGLPWLKELTKKLVWRKRNSVSHFTLISYLKVIRSFCSFLIDKQGNKFQIKDLLRPVVEDYLDLLSTKSLSTRNTYRTTLKEIFASWHEWDDLAIPVSKLIRKEDVPRLPRIKKPKVINTHAQQQLAVSLEKPSGIHERMFAMLLEVGMRAGELISLKQDCLSTDDEGSWYLKRLNLKFRNEHMVPISANLAKIVMDQIADAKNIERESKLPNHECWLFIHYYRGKIRRYTVRHLDELIVKYGIKIQLKNEFGEPVSVSSHQFRHSVGTNLINNNVSLLHVQKFLGHRNPMMTMAYAEIHDKTLKEAVMQSAVKMTDIRGKTYDPTDIFKDMGKEHIEVNCHSKE